MAAKVTPADVRDLRARHGLTQRDLARLCQTTERTIQRWEGEPSVSSSREIPPTAWLLIRAAVGEYRPRIPRPLVRKRPGPKPAKPAKAPERPHKADPAPELPAPAPTVGRSPQAQLGMPGANLKRLDPSEVDRLRRLAQASK